VQLQPPARGPVADHGGTTVFCTCSVSSFVAATGAAAAAGVPRRGLDMLPLIYILLLVVPVLKFSKDNLLSNIFLF
jgi:ABC-type transport system involved in cytochrome c biogenesis permease component